jgi:hypothetical protein
VLVNIDENRREEVEALADFVPHLIVTHPLTVGDNLDLYRLLGGVFGREQRRPRLVRRVRARVGGAQRARRRACRGSRCCT